MLIICGDNLFNLYMYLWIYSLECVGKKVRIILLSGIWDESLCKREREIESGYFIFFMNSQVFALQVHLTV